MNSKYYYSSDPAKEDLQYTSKIERLRAVGALGNQKQKKFAKYNKEKFKTKLLHKEIYRGISRKKKANFEKSLKKDQKTLQEKKENMNGYQSKRRKIQMQSGSNYIPQSLRNNFISIGSKKNENAWKKDNYVQARMKSYKNVSIAKKKKKRENLDISSTTQDQVTERSRHNLRGYTDDKKNMSKEQLVEAYNKNIKKYKKREAEGNILNYKKRKGGFKPQKVDNILYQRKTGSTAKKQQRVSNRSKKLEMLTRKAVLKPKGKDIMSLVRKVKEMKSSSFVKTKNTHNYINAKDKLNAFNRQKNFVTASKMSGLKEISTNDTIKKEANYGAIKSISKKKNLQVCEKENNLKCFESIDYKNTNQNGKHNNQLQTLEKLEIFQEKEDKRKPLVKINIKSKQTIQDQLRNFRQESFEGYGNETIKDLIKNEVVYAPDPHYLDGADRTEIRWDMRAMLLDWMVEVAADYCLKISTFHMAANYVDRYMSAKPTIKKSQYQLVGLTCMNIATKIEEVYVPKLEEFGYSASNQFSVEQIKSMEREISKTLGWRLNPPNLHLWANWYTAKWDFFLKNSKIAKNHQLLKHVKNPNIFFREVNQDSYKRYREIMQLLDTTLLDIQTLQYKLRPLVAAFMYIIIGRDFDQFNKTQIIAQFPTSSLYLLDHTFAFNDIFSVFLKLHFGLALEDLLPNIQYASTYFSLKISYDLPDIVKKNRKGVLEEKHYEQFLSYEVHNPYALNFVVKERNRKIV